MTTYNTGNPLGSSSPKDLYDNAENLDHAINAETETWQDRLGRIRKTIFGAIRSMSATPYQTLAQLTAAATPPDNKWAVVLSDATQANNGYYIWNGTAWERSAMQPATAAQLEAASALIAASQLDIAALQRLIMATGATDPLEAVVDEEGTLLRMLTQDLHRDTVHETSRYDGGMAIISDDGSAQIVMSDEWNTVGPLTFAYTDMPGVYVVDADDVVLGNLSGEQADFDDSDPTTEKTAISHGLVFGKTIVGAQGVPLTIYPAGMLMERARAKEVVATLSSAALDKVVCGSDLLEFTMDQFGTSANLTLRTANRTDDRALSLLSMKTVPVPAVSPSPIGILMIGDSIANRQGGQYTKQWLESWGYLPNFIGTFPSSASASDANNTDGPLGESREGWETGDYTLQVNNRVNIILPGEEAAYLAMDKPTQWTYNPFLRAATESDAPEDVRNGYVMDFAFYQSRFGLATPDVIVWALGTNDVRDLPAASIKEEVKANDLLFYRRAKAAWPNVKIIRSLPGTAINATRDTLWTEEYHPMLMGILEAAAATSGVTVAPTWAMANLESGFSWATSQIDPVTGFAYPATFSDTVHPTNSGRSTLYRALAPYIAAAGLGII